MRWRAETDQGQLALGAELVIYQQLWADGDRPKCPSVGASIAIEFPNGQATSLTVVEVSGDEMTVEAAGQIRWQITHVGAKGLKFPLPTFPSGAPATFWTVTGQG
jgi:hypothetical protein